jgi:hypothetical protein
MGGEQTMAIIAVLDIPGATQAQYEEVTSRLSGGRSLKQRSDWPVEGLISHAAGPTPDGWFVTDVWESEDALRRFAEQLLPLMRELGMPEVEPRTYPAFHVVT